MPLELTYNKIVIGSSLEAILFAHFNNCKIIYTKNRCPLSFDKIEHFGLGNNPKEIWEKYMFLLSLSGYNPFNENIKHIRYENLNQVKIVTKQENVFTVNYNTLYVFDDEDFLDLPLIKSSTTERIRIIDTFNYKTNKITLENTKRDSDFINQIMFDDNKKLITVVSISNKSDLEKTPEHLVKIKTEKILNINKLDLNHIERNIQNYGKNVYDDFDNVKFIYDDAKLIYLFHKRRRKIDYFKYLKLKLES